MLRADTYLQQIDAACAYLRASTSYHPTCAIILGTGMEGLTKDLGSHDSFSYKEIPHFRQTTAIQQDQRLYIGRIAKTEVAILGGRLHYYDGYDIQNIVFPVRVLKKLGIKTLFLANAAGGLVEELQRGDIMCIRDHIDLLPESPLRGENLDEYGPRYVDMNEAYAPNLRQRAQEVSQTLGYTLKEGVYVAVQGPQLETPAEYNYLRNIGAHAVGMSTVPEVITARHMGIACCALSIITDTCYERPLNPINVDEILAIVSKSGLKLQKILTTMIDKGYY